MAGIQTITIGSVNYTANASVAMADEYLAVDPVRGARWATKSTDQKGGLLVAATRRLNLFSYKGEKTGGSAQVDAWPRTGVTYPDGTPVPDTEIPLDVVNATILLAGTMAISAAAANAGGSGSNKKKVKAGSAEVEYFRPTTGVPLADETAWAMLLYWFADQTSSTNAGGAAFGTDQRSDFCHGREYPLSEGYP